MPVNVSIRQVPDDVIKTLRKRAKKHRRSLQGELNLILEEAAAGEKLGAREMYARVRRLGIQTSSDSTAIIRELRDAR